MIFVRFYFLEQIMTTTRLAFLLFRLKKNLNIYIIFEYKVSSCIIDNSAVFLLDKINSKRYIIQSNFNW